MLWGRWTDMPSGQSCCHHGFFMAAITTFKRVGDLNSIPDMSETMESLHASGNLGSGNQQ